MTMVFGGEGRLPRWPVPKRERGEFAVALAVANADAAEPRANFARRASKVVVRRFTLSEFLSGANLTP